MLIYVDVLFLRLFMRMVFNTVKNMESGVFFLLILRHIIEVLDCSYNMVHQVLGPINYASLLRNLILIVGLFCTLSPLEICVPWSSNFRSFNIMWIIHGRNTVYVSKSCFK